MPPPSPAEVRSNLGRCAQALRRQQGRLEVLAHELRRGQQPESLEDEVDPPSEEQELLDLIACVMHDRLAPTIHELERAARKGRKRSRLSPT